MSDWLHRDVLGLLCPELLGLPLAGTPWHGELRTPATVLTVPAGAAADWRRDYGDVVAGFLRGTSWTTPGRARCSASSAAAPPNACSARRRPTGRGPGHWPR